MTSSERPTLSPLARIRFTESITALGIDVNYFVEALTEKLRSMRPVASEPSLVGAERRFLIESGTFSEPELERLEAEVSRGSLQLAETQAWMASLLDTLSLQESAWRLRMTDDEVRRAAQRGELLVVEIAGTMRFPRWQFDARQPDRLLPGLRALIDRTPNSPHLPLASFMNTPQQELIGFGPQTPVQWLQNGGSIEVVLDIFDDDEW